MASNYAGFGGRLVCFWKPVSNQVSSTLAQPAARALRRMNAGGCGRPCQPRRDVASQRHTPGARQDVRLRREAPSLRPRVLVLTPAGRGLGCARVKVRTCALSGTGGGWPAKPPPCLSGDTAVAHMLQHSDAWGHEGEVFPSSSKWALRRKGLPAALERGKHTHGAPWRCLATVGVAGSVANPLPTPRADTIRMPMGICRCPDTHPSVDI